MKKLINPFKIMALIIGISFILYNFHLSNLYPFFSLSLILYFIFVVLIFTFFGTVYRYLFNPKQITSYFFNRKRIILMVMILLSLYLVEIIYSRQLPLINSIKGSQSNYQDFGIPTLHVFVQTFNVFLSNVIFLWYTLSKKKKVIFLYLITISPFILILSRGMLAVTICISVYIFLNLRKIKKRSLVYNSILILLGITLFSLLGNLRINADYNSGYGILDSSLILNIGKANNVFYNLGIFSSLFWVYLYLSSPLANLQLTCTTLAGGNSLVYLIITQWLPDFISKRLIQALNINVIDPAQITPELNVSTGFVGSYIYYGWLGLIVMALFLAVILFIVLVILYNLNNYGYFIIGNAIVATICIMSMFSNMWTFSGLNLPLMFCTIVSLFIPNYLFKLEVKDGGDTK